ncbi:MAG: RluA family pseudouridine synthase [Planctomycetaceae bacterium]|nr:RluA family pseudouridine synthase [Planctomycetaceae bacterium]
MSDAPVGDSEPTDDLVLPDDDAPLGDPPVESRLPDEPIEIIVAADEADARIDWYLAHKFPTYSRTHLRKAINAAAVRIDGQRIKAAHRVRPGETISVVLPELPHTGPQPEDIPLTILFEDDDLAVIDKPPGMVVHPAKGHWSGTLAAALQFHFDQLSSVGGATRPGIVHRLDRDTSGVIIVAKNDQAHFALTQQFADRTTEKIYEALVVGVPQLDRDLIDQPIGPHPQHRERMAIRRHDPHSRSAQSFYQVLERFDGFAHVEVTPKTGRTHQIRVHLASIGCPVLCDRLYGGRARLTRAELHLATTDDTPLLERQALHARRLSIHHPRSGARMTFEAALPADYVQTLTALRDLRPGRT